MTAQVSIGSLVGYAEQAAAAKGRRLDPVFKRLLAKAIKQRLLAGDHPTDIRWAIRLLLERSLPPFMLKAKVEDVKRYQTIPKEYEYDPLADIPEHRPDPSKLQEKP